MRVLAKNQKPSVGVTCGQPVHRSRADGRAGGDQIFGLHAARELADGDHAAERDQPARRQREAGPGRGIAEIELDKLRQELVVASTMAPVASITMKQAPNWRLKTNRRSTSGWRRLSSHGIISTKASAEIAAKRTMNDRAEPVLDLAAIEHDFQGAQKQRHQHETCGVEAGRRLFRLLLDQRVDQRHRRQSPPAR